MVLDWARQIANGMHYLHEKGMVHRDLKSPNILIAQDKRTLKISDFGTCRELKSGGHSTKMSFTGTVAWMAPEIIRSEACTDKIDVWSFGVCLWELLTGEMPYKGVDVGAVVYGVGSGKLTLPIPQSAPDGFTLLLKQCWNTQPKHRPSFRQILAHLDILRDDTEFAATPDDEFFHTQVRWRREIVERYEEMRLAESQLREREARLVRQREEELQHAAEVRELYEKKLLETTQLLQELREMENRLRKRDRDLERRLSTAARRAPNSAKKKNGRGGRDSRRKRRSAGSGNWEQLAAQDVAVRAPACSANGLSDEEWPVLEPAATVTTSLA
jgi:mitogen-activated protein kinase kinase kinase 13